MWDSVCIIWAQREDNYSTCFLFSLFVYITNQIIIKMTLGKRELQFAEVR